MLYVRRASDRTAIGSTRGLSQIIRDTGARIVVFGVASHTGNCRQDEIKMEPHRIANPLMTLDRRGDAFERFLWDTTLSPCANLSSQIALW
jgi:hypothetical protein